MSDDYGPYGSGLDGYIHYMQAINETQKGGGSGGRGSSSNDGCLCAVLYLLAAAFLVYAFIVY